MGRAVAFYRDVLGFPLETESPYWSSFRVSDSLMIGLHPPIGEPGGSKRSGWSVTIPVDDILAGKSALESAGAKLGKFEDIEGYARSVGLRRPRWKPSAVSPAGRYDGVSGHPIKELVRCFP